jgi:hypothetical protein
MAVIALLGDSIFDNKAYVGREPDVRGHLEEMMPRGWRADLIAIDGSVVRDVKSQAERLPADTTHLVVSAGGNDALSNADLLSLNVSNAAQVFGELSHRCESFQRQYAEMLDGLSRKKLRLAACTIYYPNFTESAMQKVATAALGAFNDVISVQAFRRGIPLIDLRLVCTDPADYANAIEPSGKGGRKIANAILSAVSDHDYAAGRSSIYY